jgi:hypothetical protein
MAPGNQGDEQRLRFALTGVEMLMFHRMTRKVFERAWTKYSSGRDKSYPFEGCSAWWGGGV